MGERVSKSAAFDLPSKPVELPLMRWAPFVLGTVVIGSAAASAKWLPRWPAPLIGVSLSACAAWLLHIHEPQVGSLQLTLPPFASIAWTPRDVTSVVPSGLALAFAASVNLLLTSRAVEHFRGRLKHAKRIDSDAELGAYGIANLCARIFGAPMSVGIPPRSVANVRCGGTARLSNIMHAVFLVLLVKLGSGALAHIPLAALAGVTAWMGICLLDVSASRRLSRMRPADAAGFLVTAIGVLVANAVAAVIAGCAVYTLQFLCYRYLRHPATMSQAPDGVR
jgi:SulP family sulfate permease